jgi:autotransporter-associated beta strand protein
MGLFSRILSCLFAFVVLLHWVQVAEAGPAVTDATWTNTGGGTWTDATNWTSNPDYPSGVGATARFTSIATTANRAITLGSDITVGSLFIDNSTSRTNTIGVLSAGPPTVTFDAVGTGPAILTVTGTNPTGNATPNNMFAPVILNDDLLVTVDRTQSTSAAGTFTFRGGNVSGPGGIIKQGPGTLTLADSVKTYTGATVINEGRLRINVPAGRPNGTSGITINGPGQLDLSGVGSYTFGAAGAKISLNGPGPANNFPLTFGGAIRVDGLGSNTVTNDIVLQSNSSIHIQGKTNTTELPGIISGPGSLTLPTAGTDGNIGTLILSGANTYTGGTIINDGTVNAQGASGLGASTGPLTVNNQNNTQPATNVVLNLSTTDPTTTGSLSGTTATPTSGANTVTINIGGPTFTVNQTTAGTYDGVIAGGGDFALGSLSSNTLTLRAVHTYTGATTVNAGTLRVTGSILSSSGVNVNGGTFEAATSQSIRALSITSGAAKVTTSGPRTVLKTGDNSNASPLSITGGKLDLTTNAIAVDVPDGSENDGLVSVRNAIVSGYANGSWNGNGIVSSSIGATARAVGYGLASEVAAGGDFLGTPVDGSTVVARFTISGDANLDGTVDFSDLVRLAQNYGATFGDGTPSWWTHGDFNYDGKVDFGDLVKLAQSYGAALPTEPIAGATPEFEGDLARAFAAVPEPMSPVILALASGCLALRRRGRSPA